MGGYAGMSCGASMLGGVVHVKGDAGPRCGVAMKGGDIIVEGKIGYLSGFMAHAGRIIALGGADDACADSLWGGEVWVAGPIKSLGVDSKVVEPDVRGSCLDRRVVEKLARHQRYRARLAEDRVCRKTLAL